MSAKPLTLLLLALSAAAVAASPEQAVLAAEKEWARAIAASDSAALEHVLADDLTYGHGSGRTDTKATYIDRIKSGAQKYVSVVYDDGTKVRLYGNTAVVNCVARISSITDGKPNSMHLRMLHVFVKKNGIWQLAAHQSVYLPN